MINFFIIFIYYPFLIFFIFNIFTFFQIQKIYAKIISFESKIIIDEYICVTFHVKALLSPKDIFHGMACRFVFGCVYEMILLSSHDFGIEDGF